jgi:uncharacterized protein (DUF427 family)
MATITVRDLTRDTIIAQGDAPRDVLLLEGSYYFDPAQVQSEHLIVTRRPYVCPYKGRCLYIDLQGPDGVMRDVGWVYTEPAPAYEHIRDKIAFAFGMRPGVEVLKT